MADLQRQVIHGASWNMGGTVVRQGLKIAAGIVVANLLTPEDFALVAIAVTFAGFFNELAGQGFAQALIQKEEADERLKHSVFTVTSALGLLLAAVIIGLSPLLAWFYEQPALPAVLAVLGGSLLLAMVSSVPFSLLQRDLRFREVNIIGIGGAVVSAGLGVWLAVAGFGYWALIVPPAGAMVFQAIGAFAFSGYRPALRFDAERFRTVRTFGLVLMVGGVVRFLGDNVDYGIMPRFWNGMPGGDVLLGFYYFAYEKAQQPFLLTMAQLRSVLFPALSRLQNDPEALRKMFLKATHISCLLLFPVHVLLIGLADPLVPWVFGAHWTPAVPVFQVFAVFGFLRALSSFVPSAFLAEGRPSANLLFSTFRLAALVPALLILGSRGAGPFTTALVLVTLWYIQVPVYLIAGVRSVGCGLKEFWTWTRGPVLTSVLMGLVLWGTRWTAVAAGALPVLEVALGAVAASGVYLLVERGDLTRTIRALMDARRPA